MLFTYSRKEIELISKGYNAKNQLAINNQILREDFREHILSLDHLLETENEYAIAQMSCTIDHWLEKRVLNPDSKIYEEGAILLVDFGAFNFGYELSYPHPAVLLAQTKAFCYVIPCSTRKYGKRHADCIDGGKEDGFYANTALIIDNGRWIAKDRIIHQIGKVTEDFFSVIKEESIDFLNGSYFL